MDGYYRDEKATANTFRNGWMHTGDIARMDNDGLIFYIGRLKDMIRRSGENIAAVEVEEVIMQHKAIRLAACVSVPDDLRGEEVKAYIVLQPGHTSESVSPQALSDFCRERIAYFKVPRFIEYVTEFPRTITKQEIERHALRERGRGDAWDRLAEDS